MKTLNKFCFIIFILLTLFVLYGLYTDCPDTAIYENCEATNEK